ncbi:lipopolysaccharide biosynthesis protein [Streptosporangium sp. NPDC023963]|uniref:lipopolysaccharide biosynthesis protein n=1 Tax=Streptosporangium sp. NPDC023963 TaxID=3155608 RepID=UPI003435FED5
MSEHGTGRGRHARPRGGVPAPGTRPEGPEPPVNAATGLRTAGGKVGASGPADDGGVTREGSDQAAGRTATEERGTGLMDRLRKDLRNPLFLQGYALMINTGITAVLGLGYWFLATHLYTAAAFGEGQAQISAMRLFSSLTGLAFAGALARFIPVAGRRTAEFVLRGYAVAGAAGLVAALGFLLTLPIWGSVYADLGGLGPGLFFLASVLVWTVFTLQDVTLAGLRNAVWVPVNSLAFGLVKMGLLVALAYALPQGGVFGGIFVSWIVPTAIALIPISWLIFGVIIPKHVKNTEVSAANPPRLREVGRFLAGDFPGAFSILLILYLVPVIVAGWLDDAPTFGYFSIAHTLGSMVGLLAANMAVSLTVEGSFNAAQLAQSVRNALRRTFLIVGPVVAIVVIGAPLILSVFGPGFAEAGSPLLRLMAIAVLPQTVIEICLSMLRAQSEARKLALVQIGMAVLVLTSIAVLFPHFGIAAVGYAMLGSQLLVALLVFPNMRRVMNHGKTSQVSTG